MHEVEKPPRHCLFVCDDDLGRRASGEALFLFFFLWASFSWGLTFGTGKYLCWVQNKGSDTKKGWLFCGAALFFPIIVIWANQDRTKKWHSTTFFFNMLAPNDWWFHRDLLCRYDFIRRQHDARKAVRGRSQTFYFMAAAVLVCLVFVDVVAPTEQPSFLVQCCCTTGPKLITSLTRLGPKCLLCVQEWAIKNGICTSDFFGDGVCRCVCVGMPQNRSAVHHPVDWH